MVKEEPADWICVCRLFKYLQNNQHVQTVLAVNAEPLSEKHKFEGFMNKTVFLFSEKNLLNYRKNCYEALIDSPSKEQRAHWYIVEYMHFENSKEAEKEIEKLKKFNEFEQLERLEDFYIKGYDLFLLKRWIEGVSLQ